MEHKSQPQSISWFQNHYLAGRLELRPPFQRKPVWTDKQRSFLIESILLGVPTPEVYVQVSQSDDGTQAYGVVDGQQRLRTILQFIGIETEDDQGDGEDNNDFSLDKLPETSPFSDKHFSELSSAQKKTFFQYEMCVRFLITEDMKQVEDVFKRLNKYTLPLKAQELRNATFHGAFAKLSETLADDDYWAVNRIVSPAAIRRMGDIEMMSDLLIGLLHGPQGGSAKIIDQYYEQYEEYEDEFPEQSRITRLFGRTLDAIQRIFPKISDAPRWGNRADFYTLFIALGHLFKEKQIGIRSRTSTAKALIRFAEEVDQRLEDPLAKTSEGARRYTAAIEKGVNDKSRRNERHDALLEVLTPLVGPKRK